MPPTGPAGVLAQGARQQHSTICGGVTTLPPAGPAGVLALRCALTRIVALASYGALPKVQVAGPACVPRLNFVTPLTRIVALVP